jgi:predicted membrane protein
VPVDTWRGTDFGDLHVAPTTAAAVEPVYSHAAGDVEIDLSDVDLALPAGAVATPLHSRISNGVGDLQVLVPADADVTVNASSGVGNLEVLGQSRDGADLQLSVTDLGVDRVASGRPLVLDIDMGAGNVEVQRG